MRALAIRESLSPLTRTGGYPRNTEAGHGRTSSKFPDLEPLAKAVVSYLKSDTLFIQTNKPFLEGEEIARGVTVFYDKENENEVVGVMIDHAETVLKPFVDAILAKHGVSRGTIRPGDSHTWLVPPTVSPPKPPPTPAGTFCNLKIDGSLGISPNPTAGLGALLAAPVLPDDLLHLGRAGQCHALSGTAPGRDSGMYA